MESSVPVSDTGLSIVGGVNRRMVGKAVMWKRVQRSVYSSQPTTARLAFSAVTTINTLNDPLDTLDRTFIQLSVSSQYVM